MICMRSSPDAFYKPDFDKLPSEAEYRAAEKEKEDDSLRP